MLACGALLVAAPLTNSRLPQSTRSTASKEYQVKAAFLFNFLNYTRWPKDSFETKQSPIVVAIVGADPFGPVLDATFRGERVRGRPIRIVRMRTVPDKLTAHMVFCSKPKPEQRKKILQACKARPILLIGESEGFAEDGALINFYLHKGTKVRFEINPAAVQQAKLQVSSELMKLARVVQPRRKQ